MWRFLVCAAVAAPTATSWDAILTIPAPGEPDDCVALVLVRSAVRSDLQGLGASCDLAEVYNQPEPILQLANGRYSRRIALCVPADLEVPSDTTCTVTDNTGVELVEYHVDFIESF